MNDLEQKVWQTIVQYQMLEEQDKIVVAVSGGPDSMCLLHVLKQIQQEKLPAIELIVAHVNHQLRKEAKQEEKYVQAYCEKRKIQCFVKEVNVLEMAKEQKKGLEEMGREVRYDFFKEIAQKTGANKIAIAHHQNDNAETILMNVLRGSGISGLNGIMPVREKKWIRPLIDCSRKQIEQYCEEKELKPCMDQTNFQNEYTRNKIRNIAIPYIQQEFNPNIVKTLARLSQIAQEENAYLDKQVQKAYQMVVLEENPKQQIVVDLKKWNACDVFLRKKMVIKILKNLTGNLTGIEKTHIDDIVRLCEKEVGNKYLKPNKILKVMVCHKKVFFTREPNLP